jgi:2-polyprenyl-3-methyl-5-hydroxy-6-metoxy-1,4-benzoquinol methylase
MTDIQNLHFATDQSTVDDLNSEFYGKIQFPWPPEYFERVQRADLAPRMLSQDIGYWGQQVLPQEPRIWVAGCGTNQALFTALRFQHGRVLGSDLSAESLAVCSANASSLGVENLELRRETINQVSYTGLFDYVICTGVIHHNADPIEPLLRLAQALKPEGVLELMVYNQFHRILTSAFQNAIWVLLGKPAKPDLAQELPIGRRLAETFRRENLMSQFLTSSTTMPDTAFADLLLQPVEHSFSVESLDRAARRCGLEMLTFCNDHYSRTKEGANWNLDLADPHLQELYDALPDTERWQVTNLLMAESSPMLWFYFQRQDCPRPRKPERQICDEFLNTRFARVRTQKEIFMRQPEGGYSKEPLKSPFPRATPSSPLARGVYAALDEEAPLQATLANLGVEPSFFKLSLLRLGLATSGNPYLEAI